MISYDRYHLGLEGGALVIETREINELECRKLLLDFYSSELGTHSRLIVGFSVILLTLVEIILRIEKALVLFEMKFVSYTGVFTVSLGLWYLLMRHLVYGVLVHSTIAAKPSNDKDVTPLIRVAKGVAKHALTKKILLGLPTGLYLSYADGERNTKKENAVGLILCGVLALITTLLLVWLVDCHYAFTLSINS